MEFTHKYYPPNAFRICVDEIGEDVKGTVFSPLQTEEISFGGMTELLVKMDELFDKVEYPQAFQDKRSFDEGKESGNLYRGIPASQRTAPEILDKSGRCNTFDVLVQSRKNTSWQGEVYDAKGEFLGGYDGEIALLDCIIEASHMN